MSKFKMCFENGKEVLLLIPIFSLMNVYQNLLSAQPISKQLHDIMASIYPGGSPGAVILVVDNNKIVIKEGFGITDMDSKRNITSQTNFRMASVSKQFTAMCILLLAKEKKISLNDPITKYLTGLPSFAEKIQIKHLLTHSSGLRDYETMIPAGMTSQLSDANVLTFIRYSDSLYFEPGSKFRYSNTGFCLLTEIVRKVTGIPYELFIRENIFKPLSMNHSAMMVKSATITDRAYGYHDDGGQWKFADQSITSATMGDGCVYTNTNDYLKWIRSFWNNIFLSTGYPLNPLVPRIKINNRIDYGYGWFTALEKDGSRAEFHSGESTGFHNMVFQNPSKKFLIVIFSNNDDDRISKAFDQVAEAMHVQLNLKNENASLFHVLSGIYE